jgi:ribosomal protein S18 acetylase RimI-like enzyme
MTTSEAIVGEVAFYRWSQDPAQTVLISILKEHLPHSNPLYNRILAPQNAPSRHCLFAATFPPSSASPSLNDPPFTILFADRSRHHEAQIWLFNPLITLPSLNEEQSHTLSTHANAIIRFLRDSAIPEAPGWPFNPLLKFGCVQAYLADALVEVSRPFNAVKHDTNWTHFLIPLSGDHSSPALPGGFKMAPVPDGQLDLVLSTSGIPRQAETLRSLPSTAVLDPEGALVAWAYMDVDGSLATLYVVPEHRGKGLAKAVASSLLEKLHKGEFREVSSKCSDASNGDKTLASGNDLLPFGQGSGWVHSEVKEGNSRSEKVVEGLGGKRCGMSRDVFIASGLFP